MVIVSDIKVGDSLVWTDQMEKSFQEQVRFVVLEIRVESNRPDILCIRAEKLDFSPLYTECYAEELSYPNEGEEVCS